MDQTWADADQPLSTPVRIEPSLASVLPGFGRIRRSIVLAKRTRLRTPGLGRRKTHTYLLHSRPSAPCAKHARRLIPRPAAGVSTHLLVRLLSARRVAGCEITQPILENSSRDHFGVRSARRPPTLSRSGPPSFNLGSTRPNFDQLWSTWVRFGPDMTQLCPDCVGFGPCFAEYWWPACGGCFGSNFCASIIR